MGSLQDGAPPQTRVVGERKRHSDGWTGGDNYSLFHAKPHNEQRPSARIFELLLKPFYALVSLDAVSGGVLWCRIVEHSRTLQLDHDGLEMRV